MSKTNNKYVKEVKGDLLDFPNNINIVGHCANCHCVFGAGIAAQIAKRYPEAYEADKKTKLGDQKKLGTISWSRISESKKDNPKFIANIYGQYDTSSTKRAVNYEAIARGLEILFRGAKGAKDNKNGEYIVGFPRLMGCALDVGDWGIVRAMIYNYAAKYQVKTVIVEYNK